MGCSPSFSTPSPGDTLKTVIFTIRKPFEESTNEGVDKLRRSRWEVWHNSASFRMLSSSETAIRHNSIFAAPATNNLGRCTPAQHPKGEAQDVPSKEKNSPRGQKQRMKNYLGLSQRVSTPTNSTISAVFPLSQI